MAAPRLGEESWRQKTVACFAHATEEVTQDQCKAVATSRKHSPAGRVALEFLRRRMIAACRYDSLRQQDGCF